MKAKQIFPAILLLLLSGNVFSQIKLFNNLKIAVGTTTPISWSSIHFGRNAISFGAGNSNKPFLYLDTSPVDPRLFSSSGRIVLFNTNTLMFNDLEVRTLYQLSDSKHKEKITTINNALSQVEQLRGVSFEWKKEFSSRANTRSIGFIAQEVEKIIPDAVINDSLGNKLLAYDMVIPYLVEAIKQLSAKVTELEANAKSSAQVPLLKNQSSTINKLSSNFPNPLTGKSTIQYSIQSNASSASVCFFNMQGVKIKDIPLPPFAGSGELVISGEEFDDGVYLYMLVVDGKEIDSKRMVVAKSH